jgi:large subunit ribosomal protein L23
MSIIKHPLSTEKAIRMLEAENKMVFICDRTSKKAEIKAALQEMFKIKITKINTMIDRDGNKKAIVTLSKDTPAIDVATNLGLM